MIIIDQKQLNPTLERHGGLRSAISYVRRRIPFA